MTVGDPSWPEVLEGAIRKQLAAVHTSMPGEIVDYDPQTQRATVKLGLTHNGATVPNLPDVPVLWPGGSEGFMHGELSGGDGVLVMFTEESFGQWDANGGTQDPGLLRRHGLHAAAIPGFRRDGEQYSGETGVTHLVGTEVRLGSADASQFVALASLVRAELDALKAFIASAAATEAGAGGLSGMTALNGLLAGWPTTDVAATKVKAT